MSLRQVKGHPSSQVHVQRREQHDGADAAPEAVQADGPLHHPVVVPLLPPLPRLLQRRPAPRGRVGVHEHTGAAPERNSGALGKGWGDFGLSSGRQHD